jgi:hypothetical protein
MFEAQPRLFEAKPSKRETPKRAVFTARSKESE